MTYRSFMRFLENNFVDLLQGLGLGIVMAVVSLTVGMLIGLGVALLADRARGPGTAIAMLYTGTIRNTPLLLLIFITYFGLPYVGLSLPRLETFIVTLSLYAGGYMTEVFRSGLKIIKRGYIEAGLSTGLGSGQILLHIRLPIMFRNVLPSLSNYLISLFKDTALASAITVPELTYLARKITTDTFQVVEPWVTAGLMYVVTCYVLALLLRLAERRLAFQD